MSLNSWSKLLKGELKVYPCSGIRPSSVHNVQSSSHLKPLGQSKPYFIWSLHCKWERGGVGGGLAKVYINGPGHMTKMAVRHVQFIHIW